MNPIHQFQITGLTLSGFKCYADKTDFDFDSLTVITGGNGRGKTSIADAIAFAVTGLPFFGERGIDRLHGEQNPELFVSLRFTDENGQNHELTRTRQKSRMDISYDGYSIRQHDLAELFGEKDVFLSIFNPLYFIEELAEDGKKLLERYLPGVSQEEVLAELNEATRANLENQKLLSPDGFLRNRREEIRELEQSLIYLSGQKDLAASQKQERAKRLEELEKQQAELEAERTALEEKRYHALDPDSLREKLVGLSSRYDELAHEGVEHPEKSKSDEILTRLHQKLGQREAEQYVPKYTQPIADATARFAELGTQYKREAALLKGFRPGVVCPTCCRPVTGNDLPSVQEGLRKSLSQLASQGKAQKQQLEELQEMEKKSYAAFRQFQKDDVQKLEQQITEENEKLEKQQSARLAEEERHRAELSALREEIRVLTSELEYGNLSQQEYDRLGQCGEELRQCMAQRSAVQKTEDAAVQDFDAQIEGIKAEITEKKKLLQDAALYAAKRAELIFSQLKMNKVEISLYDVVKTTGEAKDVFKFTYGGRRYDRLSLSEKVRAGMEVSELVKRLTGRNYPVFVDNMESVDDLANVRPTGQLLMAKCVRGAELSVRQAGKSTLPKAA